jgi:hypothetical protein
MRSSKNGIAERKMNTDLADLFRAAAPYFKFPGTPMML